jgi:hypothetical protein
MDSSGLGHLRFLATGPQNTIKEAPKPTLPDFHGEINWRYQFVGWVNLETGKIEEDMNEDQEGSKEGSREADS